MLEAAFVALQGILLGIVLGMVTAYNLLVNSDAFGDQPLDFSWPWTALGADRRRPPRRLAAGHRVAGDPGGRGSSPAVALRIAD